jgi:PAS domain S-box-containing protein
MKEKFALEHAQDTNSPPDSLSTLAVAQQLLDYAPVAMLIIDLNGFVLHLNTAAEQLFGYSKKELIGQKIEILVPDGLKHKHTSLRENFVKTPARRAMGEGRRLSAQHKDGHMIPIEIGLNPLSVGPIPSAVIISVLDQSAANRAERAELFVVELKHRAKNMFAVISAISRQIGASNLDRTKFESAFDERLRSFSASYELLALENWRAPTITELVRAQLNFVNQRGASTINLNGPNLRLSIDHAEYLGLAIHELATNALKHGALSVPEGSLNIHWSADDITKRFQFDWQEHGGPIVAPLRRKGFGRIILEKVVPTTFDGQAELRALPSGMCWHLEAPIAIVQNVE